jgi:hypothetical protein
MATDQNRRRHPRKIPDNFAFVQIEREEVGRVLDVSEGGLSFSSFGPVPQYRRVYLWFSFNLKERIEALAEVAWTDKSRKIGGLRFTQLSNDGQEQIRSWLSRLPAQQDSSEKPTSRVAPQVEPPKKRRSAPDRVARFVAKARTRHSAVSPILSLDTGSLRVPVFSLDTGNVPDEPAPIPAVIEPSGGLVPVERYLSAKKRQLILGVALGICITVAATGAAFKYSNYHRGETTGPVSAASLPAKNEVKVLPPVPRTETTPSAPAVDIFSASKTNSGMASKSAPGKPVAASYAYAQSHAQTSDTKTASQSVRTSGQPQLSAAPKARTNSMTPAQLWNAVQSGNSNAAVALANLYIKGEGVPQNCQQARVLLLVASEKRNAAAIKRLQELDKGTCP